MTRRKNVLTTGEVAKICNVAPRTVSKWFDTGQLSGYRIPGSKDRRIPLDQLIAFMRMHGMPTDGLEGADRQILVIDSDPQFAATLAQEVHDVGGYEVARAESAFEGGVIAAEIAPHAILVDVSRGDVDPGSFARVVRGTARLQQTRLIATASGLSPDAGRDLLREGFESVIAKPFGAKRLLEVLDSAAAVTA